MTWSHFELDKQFYKSEFTGALRKFWRTKSGFLKNYNLILCVPKWKLTSDPRQSPFFVISLLPKFIDQH